MCACMDEAVSCHLKPENCVQGIIKKTVSQCFWAMASSTVSALQLMRD